MSDALTMSSEPRTFTVKGRDYPVAPFTCADMGKLQDWINRRFPNPFEVVQAEIDRREELGRPYPISQQQFMLKAAIEQSAKGEYLLGTDEANAKAWSNEGIKEIAFLAISKADPAFSRDDAESLYGDMGMVDMYRLMELTMVSRIVSSPKSETPGETTD